MNEQEFARWQRQGEGIREYLDGRSETRKREAALVGPRGRELATLQEREKLVELRMHQIAQHGIDMCRTMTAAEGASFDEAMLELAQIRSKIRAIIG